MRYRYYCNTCKWAGDNTDIAQYHAIILDHRVEIACPDVPWHTEYACGCWYSPEESHACNKHAAGAPQ